MSEMLSDLRHEFQRHKTLADRSMIQLSDEQFFQRPGELVNPIALIVKHLAGNFASRWTNFLTTDGEKSTRDRDGEFVLTVQDTRADLVAAWERSWETLFGLFESLKESDLQKSITIRGESMSAQQALLRGATHVAYHVGQILYIARILQPNSPWLSIAPGQSKGFPGQYRKA